MCWGIFFLPDKYFSFPQKKRNKTYKTQNYQSALTTHFLKKRMSLSPQTRNQLPVTHSQQPPRHHVSPQQALYGGSRVSVKQIIYNELRAEDDERTMRRDTPHDEQQLQQHRRKFVGFVGGAATVSTPLQSTQQQKQQRALVPIIAASSSEVAVAAKKKKKTKSSSLPSAAVAGGGRFSNPYELVKRAMALDESRRIESHQKLNSQLSQKTRASTSSSSLRSRNLRFEKPVLLRSANAQPTSFISATRTQQQQQQQQGPNGDLYSLVNLCITSEVGRIFLTEEEARALSGGKVSYSVSQHASAFGSSAPHAETVQEPFCLLAVNIARALIPGTCHCVMVRRVAALVSSPVWSQKLATGISLLAHGAVNVVLKQEEVSEQQQQQQSPAQAAVLEQQVGDHGDQGTTPAVVASAVEEQQQRQQQEEQSSKEGNKKEKRQRGEGDGQQPRVFVKSHVQWAMLHAPIDLPTVFVTIYCPPPLEGLLPCGFDSTVASGSVDELLEIQRAREEREKEEDEERRVQSKQKAFAHRFVGRVFNTIGLEEEDYDFEVEEQQSEQWQRKLQQGEKADRGEDQRREQQARFQVPPLMLMAGGSGCVSSSPQLTLNNNGGRPSKVYDNAGAFVDDVFDDLLPGRRPIQTEAAVAGGAVSATEAQPIEGEQQQKEEQQRGASQSPGMRLDEGSGVDRTTKETSPSGTAAASANQQRQPQPSSRGGFDSAGLLVTLSTLHFPSDAHRDVATQICLAMEAFLYNESHGIKVRRIVVCAHSASAAMAGDVVVALRARQQAKGQSRRVMLVTTQANIASSVPRRRLEGKLRATPQQQQEMMMLLVLENDQKQQRQQRPQLITDRPSTSSTSRRANSAGGASRVEVVAPPQERDLHRDAQKKQQQQQQNERQQQQYQHRQPQGKFSEWTADQRAQALRLFFARLCIPVPKLSFDPERRRGWRFVVMPECFVWAIGYFAPGSILNYQSLEFPVFAPPSSLGTSDSNAESSKRKTSAAPSAALPLDLVPAAAVASPPAATTESSAIQQQQQQQQQAPSSPGPASPNTTQASAAKLSCGPPPSVDDIVRHLWDALSRVEGCIDSVSGGATLEGFVLASTTLLRGLISAEVADGIWDEVFASKFTASVYPPGTPIPTPPPVCCCCGGIGADYFSAREATFIRQLKCHAPAAMKPFLKRVLQRPFDAVPQRQQPHHHQNHHQQQQQQRKKTQHRHQQPTDFNTEDLCDDADDDDYCESASSSSAAANWNRAFFAENFHPVFEVLARTNAQFLPPLTALFSSSVERTRATYEKQGMSSAATVRLRLQENLYRATSMQETFM